MANSPKDKFTGNNKISAASVKPALPSKANSLAEKQKVWKNLKIKTLKKKNKTLKQITRSTPQVITLTNSWDTIPAAVSLSENKTKNVYKEMDRSKFKVVGGGDGSADVPKTELVAQGTGEVKKDNMAAPNTPGPSNPVVNKETTQSSGVKGRVPAAAFMNVDHSQHRFNWVQPIHAGYLQYPKGIPRAFLTEEHQQQLQPEHSQQSNKQTERSSSKGPAWESKIPKINETTPTWPNSRFDQLPTGQYAPAPVQQYGQQSQSYGDQAYGQPYDQQYAQPDQLYGQSLFAQTDSKMEELPAQYSPSDVYDEMGAMETNETRDDSPDSERSGSKRLSAFKRLGPVSQPKKPKLTINLLVGKEQAVREVVDESEESDLNKYTPVLERADIQTSVDDTVMKFLSFWPWKKQTVRRVIGPRDSKHLAHLEYEQMDELYEKDKMFFGIVVSGYPASWNKEDVLDAVLEAVQGRSLIPCFIQFAKHECRFLVIRSREALLAIHKLNFTYQKDDVVLKLSILYTTLSVNQVDFIPRLILRKRLSLSMEGETELNLTQFTLGPEISHFLYFPLARVPNQTELRQLQSSVPWHMLTKLVLSHNKISSISGFDLSSNTPKLKYLDLSHNWLDGITNLLGLRALPLSSIVLEGNPLCLDYIESERYVKVLKMMFPGLKEVDGVKLPVPGELPPYKRNYSPPEATAVADKVLETMFPLLDADVDERQLCEDLYMDDAVMTITYMYKLRYGPIFKDYRTLFSHARVLDEGEMYAIEGATAIAKAIYRWPRLEHDPQTFSVDVLFHTETTTILRISGIVKVTAETLAEDEHMLYFTRTLVLHLLDAEYKISNEMIYWDLPDKEQAREAFKTTTTKSKNLNLKLDAPPDAELKEKLLEIFMTITSLPQQPSKKCLEAKDWHLRNAIEYFSKLLKLDNIQSLYH